MTNEQREARREYHKKYNAIRAARQKARYNSDPEYRNKVVSAMRLHSVLLYHSDPEHRERMKQYQRDYYHNKKKHKPVPE